MKHGALVHDQEDDVAVVVSDISAGDAVTAVTLEGEKIATVEATMDIPLGHKIALREIAKDADLIKYGRSIGRATTNIAKGEHVHTQNIKSVRWA